MTSLKDRWKTLKTHRALELPDAALVFFAILASSLPYIATIGFYSDDWAFLHVYHTLGPHGWDEVLRSGLRMPLPERPLHGLYIAGLYLFFGLDPLPQHLINTGLLALSGALLLNLLRDLSVPRATALATAILFGFLPQLTTLRVWYATFQIVLSLVFFLASVRFELRWARERRAGFKLLALVLAACSLAAYETTGPLLAAAALGGAWIRLRQSRGGSTRSWYAALLSALPNLVLIAGVLLGKWLITDRVQDGTSTRGLLRRIFHTFWSTDYNWKTDDGLNLFAAISVNFWYSFKVAAQSLARVWQEPGAVTILLVAVTIAVAVLARLSRLADPLPRWRYSLSYMAAGLIVFGLGYGVFLFSTMVHFAPASTGNRMATPATIGIAMALAGLIGLLSERLGSSERWLHGVLVAAIVVTGSIHASVVAARWAEAWRQETVILDRASQDLAAVPAEATVLLDGVCPYRGPAIVFESPWDWSSALSIRLGRQVHGDVAVPSLRVTPEGLETQIYDMANRYPFGERLFLYDPVERRLSTITDLQAAVKAWPAHVAAMRSCPPGYPAMGVLDW